MFKCRNHDPIEILYSFCLINGYEKNAMQSTNSTESKTIQHIDLARNMNNLKS